MIKGSCKMVGLGKNQLIFLGMMNWLTLANMILAHLKQFSQGNRGLHSAFFFSLGNKMSLLCLPFLLVPCLLLHLKFSVT